MLLSSFILIGALRLSLWQQRHFSPGLEKLLPLKNVSLIGTIEKVRQRSQYSASVRLDSLKIADIFYPTRVTFLVYFPRELKQAPVVGSSIILEEVDLLPLPQPRNPGQFDYGRYLKWKGVSGRIFLKSKSQFKMPEHPSSFSFSGQILLPIRQKLTSGIDRYLSPSGAAILKALIVGERDEISPQVMQDFQNAGVIHVLAISGLHVGFVVVISYLIFSFFPIYFKWRNMLIIILLIFYTLLTGASPSVVRASLMASLYFLAGILERRSSLYNIIFLSAFIILMINPNQLFWSGFQFSYAAVLSIVYFFPQLSGSFSKIKERIPGQKLSRWTYRWILLPFGVSLTAQLGTIPLTVLYYYKISIVSFFLNILIIPLVGAIVAIGFLLLFLAFVIPILAFPVGQFLDILIRVFIDLVSLAAHLPGAYFRSGEIPTWFLLIYILFIVFLFIWIRQQQWKKVLVGIGGFLLLIFLIRDVSSHRFQIIFMDVGQGDAALIMTPSRKTILVDAGPRTPNWDSGKGVILPVLNYMGVQKLDYVFLSHPHNDHIGGVFSLIKDFPMDSVFLPAAPFKNFRMDSLQSILNHSQIPSRKLKMGDRVIIDPTTRAYVFAPLGNRKVPVSNNGSAINNASLVMLIKHQEQEILFPGDIEAAGEQAVMGWGNLLNSDITKIAHHGSATSSTPAFLRLNKPEIAVISVGAYNKFGHPSLQVIKRLSQQVRKVYRTDTHRAVWLRLEGRSWKEVQWW